MISYDVSVYLTQHQPIAANTKMKPQLTRNVFKTKINNLKKKSKLIELFMIYTVMGLACLASVYKYADSHKSTHTSNTIVKVVDRPIEVPVMRIVEKPVIKILTKTVVKKVYIKRKPHTRRFSVKKVDPVGKPQNEFKPSEIGFKVTGNCILGIVNNNVVKCFNK